jgi:hypothetical protein
VRLVQRAHRRHEHAPFGARLRLCVCDGGQNFHASSFTHLPMELISINASVMLSGAKHLRVYFCWANWAKVNPRFFASLRMTLSDGFVLCESPK